MAKANKLLLPVDGSEYSDHAVEYALRLAATYGYAVHMVYCMEDLLPLLEGAVENLEKLRDSLHRTGRDILDRHEKSLKESGVEYVAEVKVGDPAGIIRNLAASGDYVSVVMGSHGHSRLGGLFLGSVTQKVMNKLYVPVTVVP